MVVKSRENLNILANTQQMILPNIIYILIEICSLYTITKTHSYFITDNKTKKWKN